MEPQEKLDKTHLLMNHINSKRLTEEGLARALAVFMFNVHLGINDIVNGNETPSFRVVAHLKEEENLYKMFDGIAEISVKNDEVKHF